KVRVREYTNTGARFLEVKSKGFRGATVKDRLPHDHLPITTLGGDETGFVSERIGFSAQTLTPVLRTTYTRFTLVRDGQRVTCDSALSFSDETGKVLGPREL